MSEKRRNTGNTMVYRAEVREHGWEWRDNVVSLKRLKKVLSMIWSFLSKTMEGA